jgi:hypothetical protein
MEFAVIQTLPCPGCSRSLVLVSEVSMDATLRCANCGDCFVLRELIESQFGYWEVISDPVTAAIPLRPVSPADDIESPVGQPVEPVREAVDEQSMGLEEALPKQDNKVDWSKLEPIGPARNVRRRRKSSWTSMVPVILGGFASIPVALLMIWYLLGTDPLKLAPSVSRYFPWIVPTQMRPYEGAEDLSLSPLPRAAGKRAYQGLSETVTSSSIVPPAENQVHAGASGRAAVTTASAQLTATEAEPSSATSVDKSESSPVEVSNVTAAILQRIQGNLEAWRKRGEDRADNSRIAKALYSELTKLAGAARQESLHQLSERELAAIASRIMQQDDLRDLVNQGAHYWFEKRSSATVDLALCCEIVSTNTVNTVDGVPNWLAISTAGTKKLLVYLRPIKALDEPEIGQQVFVLGSAREAGGGGKPPESLNDGTLEIDFEPHFLANFRPNE